MKLSARKELQEILSNKTSGSTQILLKLIKWSNHHRNNKETLLEMTAKAKKELKSFSGVQSFIKEFKDIVKSKDERKINDYLKEKSKMIENRYEILYKNSLPFLKQCKRIITLSNSRTISEILKRLNEEKKIYVTVGESRPQLEGRILAKELLRKNIKVEIIPDTLLTAAIENCDCAVIGADIILSNGDVVNKTGSRGLAIACRYFKKPFYVLATKDKFSKKKKYIPEERSKKEIWNYNHRLLKKTNYYFEVIEKKLITKVLSD